MSKLAALKNKKGFTLIEIIVVLVILAILAAAAVPSMLGFVEEARGKAFIAEARVGYIAAQAVATQLTAVNATCDSDAILGNSTFQSMVKDVDPDAADSAKRKFSSITVTNGNVTAITYNSDTSSTSKGYMITVSGSSVTVDKKPIT